VPKWILLYHIIWTTKKRAMLIEPHMEAFLYQRLGAKCHEMGGYAYAVNGMPDHIHIVASIPPTILVAKFIGELKGFSSRIVGLEYKIPFAWQRSYAVFSVSKSNLPIAVEYVENQKEHHRTGNIVFALEHFPEDDQPSDSPNEPG
jgi:putative transposase